MDIQVKEKLYEGYERSSVRLSYFKNASGSAEVLEENNFYPFGMKHEGYNQAAGNPSYHYGFNGKELQKETGWGDFGARMYMSDIGRWGVIDPLAESYRRWSPYHYAMNNPANLTDPDGMGSYDANGNWRSEMADFNEYHHINSSAGGREYNSFRANDAGGGNGGGGVTMGNLLDSLLSAISNSGTSEYFNGIDFNFPPNEYIVDMKTGQVTQVSDLGGDEIDFYHYIGGGAGFNGKTRIVDRESGDDQWMNSSKNLKGYTRRNNSTNWANLYDEFLSGGGPENSLLTMGNAAVNQLMKTNMYKSAVQYFQGTSMNEKTSYSGVFGLIGVAVENSNMQGQFMGKTNFSFYPVGNKVVIMAFDSKSVSSYSLNPFNKAESRNIPRFNGVGAPESTTRQTYLLWVNKNNMLKR